MSEGENSSDDTVSSDDDEEEEEKEEDGDSSDDVDSPNHVTNIFRNLLINVIQKYD